MEKSVFKNNSLLLIVATFCVAGLLRSQDTLQHIVEDGYIEKMSGKLVLNLSINNEYETFEVRSPNSRTVLYPNAKTNAHLKLNYRFLSFGFQFAPDFLPGNGDEDQKGETKSFRLGTALVFKHWFTDINYSKVKGYYLKNSSDFMVMQPGDPYIQFPDLHFNNLSLAVGYSSNSRFSFRSLTTQTERQLRSTGSFIPTINFSYYTVNDKSSSLTTQKSRNIETSIGPGYAYTFVLHKEFYLSLGLSGSLGYLNTKLWTRGLLEPTITYQDNFILRWDGRTGFGYNGSKFYTGLYANLSGTQYEQENSTVLNFNTRVFFQVFFGIRIPAPAYLNRKVNQIEEKIKTTIKPTKQTKKNRV